MAEVMAGAKARAMPAAMATAMTPRHGRDMPHSTPLHSYKSVPHLGVGLSSREDIHPSIYLGRRARATRPAAGGHRPFPTIPAMDGWVDR